MTSSESTPFTVTPVLQDGYQPGEHTVTWLITDGTYQLSTTSTVNLVDTQAPAFEQLADLETEAQGTLTHFPHDVSAMDSLDGEIAAEVIQVNGTDVEQTFSFEYEVGEHILTWQVTDAAGNIATTSQTVRVKDTTAPVFESVLPVVDLNATGRVTLLSADNVGQAVAQDIVDGEINAVISKNRVAGSGVQIIEWQATDAAGNTATIEQTLNIHPVVEFAIDRFAEIGQEVNAIVRLSGEAVNYPVVVDYEVTGGTAASGSHNANDGQIIIDSGLQGAYRFSLSGDSSMTEGDTVEFSLVSATNANVGSKDSLTVTALQGNAAPTVSLAMYQGGERTQTIALDGDSDVTVVATIEDLNASDQHQLSWIEKSDGLTDLELDNNELTYHLDLSGLTAGNHVLRAVATELSESPLSSGATLLFRAEAAALVLASDEDSDLDGIVDSLEGTGDSDGDGIPNYIDNSDDISTLPMSEETSQPMQTTPGLKLKLGKTALAADGYGAKDSAITVEQLSQFGSEQGSETDNALDPVFTGVSDLIDFEVEQLPMVGMSVSVVIPMPDGVVLPEDAVYRKYTESTGWSYFEVDEHNRLESAGLTEQGLCPEVQSDLYVDGLNAGDSCVRLTIQDGGQYDQDGEANGVIVDPGMISAFKPAPQARIEFVEKVFEGETVTLDAGVSTGAEGVTLSYQWQQLSGPSVTVLQENGASLEILAPEVDGDFTVEMAVTVSDGERFDTETISLNIVDVLSQVLANIRVKGALYDGSFQSGDVIELNASQSMDSEGNELNYHWQQLSGPMINFDSNDGKLTQFVVPDVGQAQALTLQLTVTNGLGSRASSDTVVISAQIQPKPEKESGSLGLYGLGLLGLLGLRRKRR